MEFLGGLITLVLAAFFLFPLVNEDTSSPCFALGQRLAYEALHSEPHGDAGAGTKGLSILNMAIELVP